MEEKVILVDDQDRETGTMEKIEAHQKGLLHRAFSVFIFNSKKELLLQQRALHKYHSAGLWTNTCCSHPRPGERTVDAATRRLKEEMGLDCELHFDFQFIYKTAFDNGLTEHELDHVYSGTTDTDPVLNKHEAAAYKWISLPDLRSELESNPERYTSWFRIILGKTSY